MTTRAADALPAALPAALSLPLVGENHPLRQRFVRTFVWSALIAMLIHAAAAAGRIVMVNLLAKEGEDAPVVRMISVEQIVPPSISQEETPTQVGLATQVAAPTIGIPEPVPDYEATELTMATVEEMAEFQTSDLSALTGGGDSLVVNFAEGYLPSPDEYVAVEEMPVLIAMPPPEYPSIARVAEVEGVVVLRVLVGEDGNVKNVKAMEGPEMLRQAAMDAAKQGKFKPALQQHRPVAVWVVIPMEFKLSS